MADNQSEIVNLIINLVNKSDISSIKQIVTEILKTIRDEKSSAKDLKDIIEKDPPLCAKVLKLANSAQYGYAKTINNIKEAVVCIGFDAVREIALNQKVCELFMNDRIYHGYSRWLLWQHSSAVAKCCKMIYRREFKESGEDIYVAGLLHDLGMIIEDQFFNELFREALFRSEEHGINLFQAEKDILKTDHTEIIWVLAKDWDFPAELSQAMGHHHDVDSADEEYQKLVYTLFIANYTCQQEKIGYDDTPAKNTSLYNKCLYKLGIKAKAMDLIVRELKEELRKSNQMEFSES